MFLPSFKLSLHLLHHFFRILLTVLVEKSSVRVDVDAWDCDKIRSLHSLKVCRTYLQEVPSKAKITLSLDEKILNM